jgi:hypothetical protein
MPEASKLAEKRKRGGQPGNRNRLLHGRYTQDRAAWRVERRAYRRKARALTILVRNVLKARQALKRRQAARVLAAARAAMRRPRALRAKRCAQQRWMNTGRFAVCRYSARPPPGSANRFANRRFSWPASGPHWPIRTQHACLVSRVRW